MDIICFCNASEVDFFLVFAAALTAFRPLSLLSRCLKKAKDLDPVVLVIKKSVAQISYNGNDI